MSRAVLGVASLLAAVVAAVAWWSTREASSAALSHGPGDVRPAMPPRVENLTEPPTTEAERAPEVAIQNGDDNARLDTLPAHEEVGEGSRPERDRVAGEGESPVSGDSVGQPPGEKKRLYPTAKSREFTDQYISFRASVRETSGIHHYTLEPINWETPIDMRTENGDIFNSARHNYVIEMERVEGPGANSHRESAYILCVTGYGNDDELDYRYCGPFPNTPDWERFEKGAYYGSLDTMLHYVPGIPVRMFGPQKPSGE